MTSADLRDEVLDKAKALLEPRLERHTRQFQERLSAIRFDPVKKRDWEEARIVEGAVGDYVSTIVSLVSDTLGTTLNALRPNLPDADVDSLFLTLLPSLGDTRTFVYSNAQGLGFQAGVGFTLAIEDAHRLAVQEEKASLRLLSAQVRKPTEAVHGTHNQPDALELQVAGDSEMGTFVALDTQMLLEFKHLNELKPEDFGVQSPAKWLITRTVEREVDLKKRSGEKRIQRRARQVDALLDDQTLPVRRFRPKVPIDHAAFSLDPAHKDDAILGELIAFRNEYPSARLVVVSDDGGFRRNARDLGFDVVDPDQDLRRSLDALEQENIDLRERVTDLQNVAPKLSLAGERRPLIALVCEALSDQQVEHAVSSQMAMLAPKEDSPQATLLRSASGMLTGSEKNPRYGEHRVRYEAKFRDYYVECYRVDRRRADVRLLLTNGGAVPAEKIEVEIFIPPQVGIVYAEFPKRPELPAPPNMYKPMLPEFVAKNLRGVVAPGIGNWRSLSAGLPEDNYGPRIRKSADGTVCVVYRRSALGQKKTIVLPEFFIILDDTARGGFELKYEIRSLAPGVETGSIAIRLEMDVAPPPETPILSADDELFKPE